MREKSVDNRQWIGCLTVVCAIAGACSGDEAGKPTQMKQRRSQDASSAVPERKGDEVPSDGFGSDGRIVAACQGFPLMGIRYSPGGSTLPNSCAPFHAAKNNPYAIRCIDALPDFETPFPGDDQCILPPAPDQGFQVGVHPGGLTEYWEKMWAGEYSFYRDPDVTKAYELAGGAEVVQNYHAAFDAPAERFFYRRQFRGRYGSHHGIITFTSTPITEEGWQGDEGTLTLNGPRLMQVQNAQTDFPQGSLEIPPEEEGLGYPVPHGRMYFNLHHFNHTDEPILRENWINVWYLPADQVTNVTRTLTVNLGVDYPPDSVLDNSGSLRIPAETQLLSLYGHHHAWTSRFHATLVRAGGDEQLIYDSYDFWEMPTFSYNSLAKNPPAGVEGMDGAHSGPLVLQAGDVIKFNCRVETTKARADELGVAPPVAPLRFGNQAFDAEMCVLLGETTQMARAGRSE